MAVTAVVSALPPILRDESLGGPPPPYRFRLDWYAHHLHPESSNVLQRDIPAAFTFFTADTGKNTIHPLHCDSFGFSRTSKNVLVIENRCYMMSQYIPGASNVETADMFTL